jgi:hypothetical protein
MHENENALSSNGNESNGLLWNAMHEKENVLLSSNGNESDGLLWNAMHEEQVLQDAM